MGGTAGACTGDGACSLPLLRFAPGGSPTVGTLEVLETKVGSEIRVLLTARLVRPVWPGARWGMTWLAAAANVGAGGEFGSGEISCRGGVALAEYGAMGDGRGEEAPIIAGGGPGGGRSSKKKPEEPARLSLR